MLLTRTAESRATQEPFPRILDVHAAKPIPLYIDCADGILTRYCWNTHKSSTSELTLIRFGCKEQSTFFFSRTPTGLPLTLAITESTANEFFERAIATLERIRELVNPSSLQRKDSWLPTGLQCLARQLFPESTSLFLPIRRLGGRSPEVTVPMLHAQRSIRTFWRGGSFGMSVPPVEWTHYMLSGCGTQEKTPVDGHHAQERSKRIYRWIRQVSARLASARCGCGAGYSIEPFWRKTICGSKRERGEPFLKGWVSAPVRWRCRALK